MRAPPSNAALGAVLSKEPGLGRTERGEEKKNRKKDRGDGGEGECVGTCVPSKTPSGPLLSSSVGSQRKARSGEKHTFYTQTSTFSQEQRASTHTRTHAHTQFRPWQDKGEASASTSSEDEETQTEGASLWSAGTVTGCREILLLFLACSGNKRRRRIPVAGWSHRSSLSRRG